MSLLSKFSAFLERHFAPVALPLTPMEQMRESMARSASRRLGLLAGDYVSRRGGSELFRDVEAGCLDLIRNNEFDSDAFQEGYRSLTGRHYTFNADVESNDVFGLEAKLMDHAHKQFSRNVRSPQ